MPYNITKIGNEYCLIRKDGTKKSCHSSKAKAKAAAAIIMSKEKKKR